MLEQELFDRILDEVHERMPITCGWCAHNVVGFRCYECGLDLCADCAAPEGGHDCAGAA